MPNIDTTIKDRLERIERDASKGKIDVDLYLPVFIRKVLTGFLRAYFPDKIPNESLILDILYKMAQVISLDRLSIPGHAGIPAPCNIYALIFLPSGVGKDSPLNTLDEHLMVNYFGRVKSRMTIEIDRINESNRIEAQNKGYDNEKDIQRYVLEHSPKEIGLEPSNATVEGFELDRQTWQSLGLGGTSFQVSEFADFLENGDGSRDDLLSFLVSIYDNGNSKSKSIKGERKSISVKGVPSNLLFHTSLVGLEQQKNKDKIMKILQRGLGRRVFVSNAPVLPIKSCPNDRESLLKQVELEQQLDRSAKVELEELRVHMDKVMDAIFRQDEKIIKFNLEASLVLRAFKNIDNDLWGVSDDGMEKYDLSNRDWKMKKLAGLLAVFNHPDLWEITDQDVYDAIYLSSIYSQHFLSFTRLSEADPCQIMANYLINHPLVGKTELRKSLIVPAWRFTKFWHDEFITIQGILEERGYVCEERSTGKTAKNIITKRKGGIL